MIPLELIIVGGILSILNLLAHLLRHIPKFKKLCDKIDKSSQKLKSIKESIKSDQSIMYRESAENDLEEVLEIADDFIQMLEEITFSKPN